VSERPKEHASKACEVNASVGSNPTATASSTRQNAGPPAQGAPGVSLVVAVMVAVGRLADQLYTTSCSHAKATSSSRS
jgi:hypothetical protein